jgi:hypothetical protein
MREARYAGTKISSMRANSRARRNPAGRCAGSAGPAWVVSCRGEGGAATRAKALTWERYDELGASTPRSPVAVQARGRDERGQTLVAAVMDFIVHAKGLGQMG